MAKQTTTRKTGTTAKTTTRKTGAATKTAAKTATKAAKADPELQELFSLAQEIGEMEAQHSDFGGQQHSYLKLVGNTANDPITRKGKSEYIEDAEHGSWVLPNQKILLGHKVELTVLGMFKVYEDTVEGEKKDPKSKQEPMRKVVGYWLPEDAENIPVEGIFDRPYVDRDGVEHILRPVHWVRVFLHEYPEIDDALITFRSKGNSVYKQLQKLIANNASNSTELRLIMSHQEIPAKGYDIDYIYPYFEIAGNNYVIENNKIKLIKGGFDKDTLAQVIKTAHEDQKSYIECKMVSKKQNIASIVAGATNMIEDRSAAYIEDDEDEDTPAKF